MGDIKKFIYDREREFPVNEEILQRITKLIYEYEGEVPMVSILGILDLVKDEIKDSA